MPHIDQYVTGGGGPWKATPRSLHLRAVAPAHPEAGEKLFPTGSSGGVAQGTPSLGAQSHVELRAVPGMGQRLKGAPTGPALLSPVHEGRRVASKVIGYSAQASVPELVLNLSPSLITHSPEAMW